jgi:hypothetical protein
MLLKNYYLTLTMNLGTQVEKTTKSIRATYNRFHLWGQALSKVLDINFNIPQMEDNRIIFKGLR